MIVQKYFDSVAAGVLSLIARQLTFQMSRSFRGLFFCFLCAIIMFFFRQEDRFAKKYIICKFIWRPNDPARGYTGRRLDTIIVQLY